MTGEVQDLDTVLPNLNTFWGLTGDLTDEYEVFNLLLNYKHNIIAGILIILDKVDCRKWL